MSGSFESVQWNAYVHRPDLGLYSHPKEFWGNGVRTHVDSKGKIPSMGGSEEGQTCDAASLSSSGNFSLGVNMGSDSIPPKLFWMRV